MVCFLLFYKTYLQIVGSIQNELNDFLQKPTGNHVSANEFDSGTNYLRQPRYHYIYRGSVGAAMETHQIGVHIFDRGKSSMCGSRRHAKGSCVVPFISNPCNYTGDWSASRPTHLILQEKRKYCSLNKTLDGPQSRSEGFGEEIIILARAQNHITIPRTSSLHPSQKLSIPYILAQK